MSLASGAGLSSARCSWPCRARIGQLALDPRLDGHRVVHARRVRRLQIGHDGELLGYRVDGRDLRVGERDELRVLALGDRLLEALDDDLQLRHASVERLQDLDDHLRVRRREQEVLDGLQSPCVEQIADEPFSPGLDACLQDGQAEIGEAVENELGDVQVLPPLVDRVFALDVLGVAILVVATRARGGCLEAHERAVPDSVEQLGNGAIEPTVLAPEEGVAVEPAVGGAQVDAVGPARDAEGAVDGRPGAGAVHGGFATLPPLDQRGHRGDVHHPPVAVSAHASAQRAAQRLSFRATAAHHDGERAREARELEHRNARVVGAHRPQRADAAPSHPPSWRPAALAPAAGKDAHARARDGRVTIQESPHGQDRHRLFRCALGPPPSRSTAGSARATDIPAAAQTTRASSRPAYAAASARPGLSNDCGALLRAVSARPGESVHRFSPSCC